MVIVCDKCLKPLKDSGTKLNLREQKFEVCDECASKIVNWLRMPEKQGFLGGLFK